MMSTLVSGEVAGDARVIASVDSIPESEWDGLVDPADLFGSHAWLRHLDWALAPHQVATVWTNGQLAAAAPIWAGEHSGDPLFGLAGFFPKVSGPWGEPFVWLGARRSVHNELICCRGPSRRSALSRLLTCAVDYARLTGSAGVILPYLPVSAADELSRWYPSAHALLHSAEATVEVPPQGTRDLVAQFSSHNRKRRKHELREFAASGHRLTWTDLTADVEFAIAPLIAANRRKYGSDQGTAWMHRVFEAQRRVGLLDRAKVLLCHRGNDLVTTTVGYEYGDCLHVRYFGADETMSKKGFPYFVTACYAQVDYAAEAGLRQVRLSTSSLEAKVRRGATLMPLAAVVVLTDQDLDRVEVRAHNRRTALDQLQRFQACAFSVSPQWHQFLDASYPRERA